MHPVEYIRGTMLVRLADPALVDDLVAHLRRNGFLVVRIERQVLQVQPLYTVSERHDRRLLLESVGSWTATHPEAQPDVE